MIFIYPDLQWLVV